MEVFPGSVNISLSRSTCHLRSGMALLQPSLHSRPLRNNVESTHAAVITTTNNKHAAKHRYSHQDETETILSVGVDCIVISTYLYGESTCSQRKCDRNSRNGSAMSMSIIGCLDDAAVRRRTRDRKVAGSTPGRGTIKSTSSTQLYIPPG